MTNESKRSIRHMFKSRLNQIVITALLILTALLTILTYFIPSLYVLLVTLLLLIGCLDGYCLWLFLRFRQEGAPNGDDKSGSPSNLFHAIPNKEKTITCPDCGLSFPMSNATRLSQNILLCPVCGARLRVAKL